MIEGNLDDIEREKKELREMVSARLWDVSDATVIAFERGKRLFSANVPQSSSNSLSSTCKLRVTVMSLMEKNVNL